MRGNDGGIHMERIRKLIETMPEFSLTHYVVGPGPNLRYLTGLSVPAMERLTLFGASESGRAAIVGPALEEEALSAAGVPVYLYSDAQGPELALRRFAEELGLRAGAVVGVDGLALRLFEARRLMALGCRLEAADHVPMRLRLCKDADEIEAIAQAAAIVDRALDELMPALRVGMSELEIAAELEYRLRKFGSDGAPFATIVASGPRSALPHAAPSARRVAVGELVVFDFGATVDGYAADTTRTLAFGEPPERAVRVYEIVRAAQAAALAACGPGVPLCDIDRAARQVIEEAGYGDRFTHRTGHGLGVDVHESPSVVAGETLPAIPGMVFTVEPGIYLPDEFGVRIEDDVTITAGGVRVLTAFPKQLIVV